MDPSSSKRKVLDNTLFFTLWLSITPKMRKPVRHCHGPGVADVTKEKPLPIKEVDCPANW